MLSNGYVQILNDAWRLKLGDEARRSDRVDEIVGCEGKTSWEEEEAE